MTISRRTVLMGTAGLAALALAGCTGNAAAPAGGAPTASTGSLEALVEAAKKEGTVRVYTALTQPDMEAMVKGFQDKYGIKVDAVRLGGADGPNRLDAEARAGAKTADIGIFSDPAYFAKVAKDGLTVPIRQTGILELVEGYPAEYISDEYETAILQIAISGWSYNPAKISANEVPKTWDELLDPKWKGRLGTTPGAVNGNALLTWHMVEGKYGDDYTEKLKGQIKRIYPNLVPMQEAVAAGEIDIALSSLEVLVNALKKKGASIEFQSVNPTHYPTITFGIVTKAEHPNAARLLAHYLMSEDGTKTINPSGAASPRDKAKIPADFHIPTQKELADATAKRDKYAKLS